MLLHSELQRRSQHLCLSNGGKHIFCASLRQHATERRPQQSASNLRIHERWPNCHASGPNFTCRAGQEARVAAAEHADVLKVAIGGREVTLESGEVGRQANGAILIRDGETVLYTTACCDGDPVPQGGFSPFQVNYSERFSAAGKTSGSFFRREGRPKTMEMINARLTDRPLRPMLPKGWAVETQVLTWLMSYDNQHQPEPLAITAAGAALAISDIPLSKAVAGVRVGLVEGELVVNPTVQQQAASRLDLVMAGTAEAILMIEGFCDFLTDEQMLEALRVGEEAISHVCKEIQAWAAKVGKPKRTDLIPADTAFDEELQKSSMGADIRAQYLQALSKHERGAAVLAIKTEGVQKLVEKLHNSADGPEIEKELRNRLWLAVSRLEAGIMRNLVLEEGVRADGRGLTEVRPISSRCGLLPRTHGSVLFTRGETQAIAVTTLGSQEMVMRQDNVAGTQDDEGDKRFYLQYSFPPSSVGETGRVGGVGRREAGHGMLAERALAPIIPSEEEFPYTIRVESTITESNGSSSMASVCGGCLSLLDAGVPIKREVAGVAMGLILTDDGRHKILTDILGSEDALGDMDFKVAGDADGITAFQMDIKVEGISLEVMAEALAQAKAGRTHILQEMRKCSPPPRRELGPHTVRVVRVTVHPSMIGIVIGGGGKTIRGIESNFGVNVTQGNTESTQNVFSIAADSWEAAHGARDTILGLVEEPEVGKIYRNCKVTNVENFGLFVEFLLGRQGLLHVSELGTGETLASFKADDTVDVLLAATDGLKFKLSRSKLPGMAPSGGGKPSGKSVEPPPPGTLIRGMRIAAKKEYGWFVENAEGLRGLVHFSEQFRPGEKRDSIEIGDKIDVVMLESRARDLGKLSFSRKEAVKRLMEESTAAAA